MHGVQSEGAPAAYETWRARTPRTTGRIDTFAEGLATRASFALPQAILQDLLDDFVLVTDADLYRAMRLLLVEGHLVAEGAGAAATVVRVRLGDGTTFEVRAADGAGRATHAVGDPVWVGWDAADAVVFPA